MFPRPAPLLSNELHLVRMVQVGESKAQFSDLETIDSDSMTFLQALVVTKHSRTGRLGMSPCDGVCSLSLLRFDFTHIQPHNKCRFVCVFVVNAYLCMCL